MLPQCKTRQLILSVCFVNTETEKKSCINKYLMARDQDAMFTNLHNNECYIVLFVYNAWLDTYLIFCFCSPYF